MNRSQFPRMCKRRVVHLGCVGSGKSTNGLSIQQTIASRSFPGQIIKANSDYTRQERQLALHQRVEPSSTVEAMTIRCGDMQIDWEFWPGEFAMLDDAVDAQEIDAELRRQSVDLLVVTLNPLRHDQELAEYAFLELIWFIQEKTQFDLQKSMRIAAELLWNLTDIQLESLNADLSEVTDEQYREGQVIRQSCARFGSPLSECFAIQGCDDGDKLLDILTRTARTTGANVLEILNLQAITACRPNETVVIGTHADLLKFLPGVGESEFLRSCRQAFPKPAEVRVGQVLPQASLDITIRSDLKKPIWIKGASAHSELLLNSVVDMLGRSRKQIRFEQEPYIAGAFGIVAAASIPVAVFVSAWSILPLIAIGAWSLLYLLRSADVGNRGFRWNATKRKTCLKSVQTDIREKPTELTMPPTHHNRMVEQLPSRNGNGSKV